MQESDRRVDYDVAGEEHFFAAGTDMHRHVAWRVTGGVEGGHARRHLRSGLDLAQAGGGQFQIRLGNHMADTLPGSSGSLQKATSASLAMNSADGNSSDAFLASLIPHRWSKWK